MEALGESFDGVIIFDACDMVFPVDNGGGGGGSGGGNVGASSGRGGGVVSARGGGDGGGVSARGSGGDGGVSGDSQQLNAMLELGKRLPNARVVYCAATGMLG